MSSGDSIWEGVYQDSPAQCTRELVSSNLQAQLDSWLLPFYLQQTRAHLLMLGKQKILSKTVVSKNIEALRKIELEFAQGKFTLDPALGDLHENIETTVITRLGETGKQIHTARSRNDQIETDTRLYLRGQLLEIVQAALDLQQTLLEVVKASSAIIMPGYTHLRAAQPMTVGFWLSSYLVSLQQDMERLFQVLARLNYCPLGSGASFGVPYPIDRDYVASILGFTAPTDNALEGISNRGEMVAEAMVSLGFLFTHLGRLANELILFSTPEFGFVKIDERYTTGSSIMPQKQNPDTLELLRGQSANLLAEFVRIFALLRSLPSGYQRDTRESKQSLAILPGIAKHLQVLGGLLATLIWHPERMTEACLRQHATATDLADTLVQEYKIPFRDAHAIVGKLAQKAEQSGHTLAEVEVSTLARMVKTVTRKEHNFPADFLVRTVDPAESVKRRSHTGGTAPKAVLKTANKLGTILTNQKNQFAAWQKQLDQAGKRMMVDIGKVRTNRK